MHPQQGGAEFKVKLTISVQRPAFNLQLLSQLAKQLLTQHCGSCFGCLNS